MKWLSEIQGLTPDEKALLIKLINNFGDKEHPIADFNNLGEFGVSYVISLIDTVTLINNEQRATLLNLKEQLKPDSRIDKYRGRDREIIKNTLVGIWNTRPYKSCKDIYEVWEKIIEKTGSSELIAIIQTIDFQGEL